MKNNICKLLIVFMLVACNNHGITDELNRIDSLVVSEQYDSAYNSVQRISKLNLKEREDLAHYHLLQTQTSLLTRHPDTPSTLDSLVIPYYKKVGNHEKLAEAFYYKAYMKAMEGDFPEAIILYKKAEEHAAHTSSFRLKYKIAEVLSAINDIVGNHQLQLKYAKNSLQIAQIVENKEWMGYAYLREAVAHSKLQHKDSAVFYMKQAMPYAKYFAKQDLPAFTNNVAYVFKDSQPEMAKKYLKQSLALLEHSQTLQHLADIYYAEGNQQEAYRLWKRALVVDNGTRKDQILYNLLEYDVEHGHTENVCKVMNEIIQIKDSMLYSLRNDTLKDLQLRLDHEVAMHEQELQVGKWQKGVLVAVIIILLLASILIIRRYAERNRIQKTQLQINDYVSQLREMEATGKENIEEIAKLNKQMKDYLDEKAPELMLGRMYYEDIKEDRIKTLSLAGWKKKQEQLFIDYYTAIDYRTVSQLRKAKRKEKLTTHMLFFLLLQKMGKSDKDIVRLFGIQEKAIDVYRSRTQIID